MNRISGKTFSGVEVNVDDTEFINCEFSNCALVYRGGMYRFDPACRFSHVSFQFRDSALRTFEFMRGFGMVGDKRPIYGDDSKKPT